MLEDIISRFSRIGTIIFKRIKSQPVQNLRLHSHAYESETRDTPIGYEARNPTGDIQKPLDIECQDIIVREFRNHKEVAAIISEENLSPIILNEKTGKYIIAVDPLDGSANIDSNGLMGTIYSVFERVTELNSELQEKDFLQKGTTIKAAGYILYSQNLIFCYALDNKVYYNALDLSEISIENEDADIFHLTERKISTNPIKLPREGKIYSINEAYSIYIKKKILDKIDILKKKNKKLRYTGALVADFHNILINGGIYMYPDNSKAPSGKLRLLYECNPLAFIAKIAGGKAINGEDNILDIAPKELHQKTPLYIGSTDVVKLFKEGI